jgi:hypothetical protein
LHFDFSYPLNFLDCTLYSMCRYSDQFWSLSWRAVSYRRPDQST